MRWHKTYDCDIAVPKELNERAADCKTNQQVCCSIKQSLGYNAFSFMINYKVVNEQKVLMKQKCTWCNCQVAHSWRSTCLQWKRCRNMSWYLVNAFLEITRDSGHLTYNPSTTLSTESLPAKALPCHFFISIFGIQSQEQNKNHSPHLALLNCYLH
jgi:hypothetical protein